MSPGAVRRSAERVRSQVTGTRAGRTPWRRICADCLRHQSVCRSGTDSAEKERTKSAWEHGNPGESVWVRCETLLHDLSLPPELGIHRALHFDLPALPAAVAGSASVLAALCRKGAEAESAMFATEKDRSAGQAHLSQARDCARHASRPPCARGHARLRVGRTLLGDSARATRSEAARLAAGTEVQSAQAQTHFLRVQVERTFQSSSSSVRFSSFAFMVHLMVGSAFAVLRRDLRGGRRREPRVSVPHGTANQHAARGRTKAARRRSCVRS